MQESKGINWKMELSPGAWETLRDRESEGFGTLFRDFQQLNQQKWVLEEEIILTFVAVMHTPLPEHQLKTAVHDAEFCENI